MSKAIATPTAMRRFQFIGSGSDKFWSVAVNGAEVTVWFGRCGTNGQSNTRSFSNAGAAQHHADKVSREKTAKGYVEVR